MSNKGGVTGENKIGPTVPSTFREAWWNWGAGGGGGGVMMGSSCQGKPAHKDVHNVGLDLPVKK